MKLGIFEDSKFADLYPLTFLRPTFELRCGHASLAEKIVRAFPDTQVAFFVRDHLKSTFQQGAVGLAVNDLSALQDDLLLVNGRWLFPEGKPELDGDEEVGICDEAVAYARLKKETAAKCAADTFDQFLDKVKEDLPTKQVSATLINYPWDLIEHNPKAIEADFQTMGKSGIEGEFAPQSVVYGDESQVYVSPGAKIHPMVVIDTHGGPVTIDEGAIVFPHTRIEGPGYIGRDTHIVGGKIREGCSIGPVCRVGGEVEESIIHGYSNKYHDGFLGHAYVGEWVNLGALTTNSDLKNDYGNVEVYVKGKLVDTGSTKVGCFIGDHTKTSIGTLFNTGTMIGVGCLTLTGGKVLPKSLPSFAWYLEGKIYKGSFKAFLETARVAMSRRDVKLTQEDIDLLTYVRDLTKEERTEAVRKSRKAAG